MFRKFLWGTLLVSIVASPAAAQETEDGDEGEGRFRQQRETRGADEVVKVNQLHEAMLERMEFDEEQKGMLADVFDAHLVTVEEAQKRGQRDRRATAQEMGDLMRQAREAREAGDTDEARRLHEQMQALRGGPAAVAALNQEFHQAIRELLDEDQVNQFEDILKTIYPERARERRHNPNTIMQALREVDLDETQEQAVRGHLKEYMETMRDARTQGPEEIDRRYGEFRQAIVDELTEEQVAKFEEAEQKLQGARARGGMRQGRPDGDRTDPAGEQTEEDVDDHGTGADAEADPEEEDEDPDGGRG